MAQILWKGGVEPPDVKPKAGGTSSVATYTGSVEEELAEMEVDTAEEGERQPVRETFDLDAMVARVSEKWATERQSRPVEQVVKDVHKQPAHESTEKQQQGQKVKKAIAPQGVASKGGVATRRSRSLVAGAGVYELAQRRQKINLEEQPLIIASDNQRMPVMMSLSAVAGSTVPVQVVIEEPEPEPKKAQIVPLRFPLTEEQQKAEKLYRETGIKPADISIIKEMFEPGWTVAGVLSPKENVQRVKLRLNNLRFDAEAMALKAKHAAHDFLYKKRPLPGKPGD